MNSKQILRRTWELFKDHVNQPAEVARLRQQARYLALSEVFRRYGGDGSLSAFELSVFSQNGEDGVLLEIFHRIGTTNRFFVEIGAHAHESNAVLLADVFGWNGLFVDASSSETRRLRDKYGNNPRVAVLCHRVSAKTFEDQLRRARVPTTFDLLSIDVDGNDYWLWDSLESFHPRVVLIEYNAALKADAPLAQRYNDEASWDLSVNFGTSLAAIHGLARRKGYSVVHAETTGINLFLVETDLCEAFDIASVPRRGPNYFHLGKGHPGVIDERRFEKVDSEADGP